MAPQILNAILPKPYDIDALYASWTDAPVFQGKAKDDPVEWLAKIKAGCKERKVPKEHWARVAHHYMAPKPKARVDELGKVLQQMTGQNQVWDWKRFKVAVQNIGWTSNSPKSKTLNPPISERPMPKKQGSWWVIGRSPSGDKDKDSKDSKDSKDKEELVVAKSAQTQVPMGAKDAAALTTVTTASAPAWLVNACSALELIASSPDTPKLMSAMSAILVTVGALPALPGVAATVGGGFLASGAVQAVGAVCVGVGHALKVIADGQQQAKEGAVQTQTQTQDGKK